MFSSKNVLSLSVVAMLASGAAFAQDSAAPSTEAAPAAKKTSVGGKLEKGVGAVGADTKKGATAVVKDTEKGASAVVKDTEKGVKAVGRGTKKAFTGTEHEMSKLTHIGHKKAKAPVSTDAAAGTTSTTTGQ